LIITEAEQGWIEVGYEVFALEGPNALKVEKLSRVVGKNKSSFYHHFADLEVFKRRLLEFHLSQARIVADKETNSQNEAELSEVILQHKKDLLFNRQLRIHRDNPDFKKCFDEVTSFATPAVLPVWKKIIGLSENNYLAEAILALSLENFFLQITDETLTIEWLRAYFENIRSMIAHFKKLQMAGSLDGSV
jgi:AcrR family transcriptional regulator